MKALRKVLCETFCKEGYKECKISDCTKMYISFYFPLTAVGEEFLINFLKSVLVDCPAGAFLVGVIRLENIKSNELTKDIKTIKQILHVENVDEGKTRSKRICRFFSGLSKISCKKCMLKKLNGVKIKE